MRITIHTDGGSRGNPGPSASGAVLKDAHGNVLAEISKYLGMTTNNQAEYTAIVLGLEKARELGAKDIRIFMDSELAVRQLAGIYRVKNPELLKEYHSLESILEIQAPHLEGLRSHLAVSRIECVLRGSPSVFLTRKIGTVPRLGFPMTVPRKNRDCPKTGVSKR